MFCVNFSLGSFSIIKHGPMFVIFDIHSQPTLENGVQAMTSVCVQFFQNAATEMMRLIRTHSLCLKIMAPFSEEDKVLIKTLCEQKGYNAGHFIIIYLS